MTAVPHLSVIVPAHNGEDRLPGARSQLGAWLDALPCSSELIIVDDCSGLAAARVMTDFAAGRPHTRVIR